MSEIMEYKCPCCGGAVEFNSGIQKMKCPYCDTEFDIPALQEYEEQMQQEAHSNMNWESEAGSEWQDKEQDGMQVYVCESCGGEIIGDQNTGATTCPYCGNHVAIKGKFAGDLRPDCVIPFQLDKKAAKEGLKRHTQGKKLLPKPFRDENHLDEIKGVYVPFWLFNATAEGKMQYKATRVRSWSDSRYNYTETQFYSVLRGGSVGFSNVPVDGSSRMPDELMESIEPFDASKAVQFQTAYLAGYLADKYDVEAKSGMKNVNTRIQKSTEEILRNSVDGGYMTVNLEKSQVNLKNSSQRYALYPVWILNTTWKGNNYLFAMNGQTGKFVGDLPVDKGAYWRWHGIWTAGFAVVLYILILLIFY